MYVTRVPNRGSPPAILLRESYRAGGKVRTRTLANLSRWPEAKIEALRRVLKGETLVAPPERLTIERSLPHGHVAAVLGMARKLGLDRLLPRRPERLATLALALVVARVLEPAAKLATARQLSEASAAQALGAGLGLGAVDEDELYRARDLLGGAQAQIEARLARRHLRDGCLVLYDLTSSWLEGRCCELARFGYSRDGQRAKLQIVFGLLCTAEGCPIAVEVFEGDTADPATLAAQVAKLKERFKLGRVVLVGDRGRITAARIAQDLKPAGLDWITALRAPAIQALAAEGGPLQLSLFDQRDLAEVTSPDYPGERLVVCRNPGLAAERARKRAALLAATEQDLAKIVAATRRARAPLRGRAQIALKVGAVLGRRKMAKHFGLTITDDALTFARDDAAIAREAALDGFYVVHTSVPPRRWMRPPPCWPTRAWPRSSAPSAPSRRSTSRSGRSTIAEPAGCGRTSSCACSPTTFNGTCVGRWPRSCSTTTTGRPPLPPGPHRWPRPGSRPLPPPRPRPDAPTPASRCTAGAPCSPISPP